MGQANNDLKRLTSNTDLPKGKIVDIPAINRFSSAKLSDFDAKDIDLITYTKQWLHEFKIYQELGVPTVKEYITGKRQLLKPLPIIIGDVGVGKTHFLNALYNNIVQVCDEYLVINTPSIQMIYDIKNGIATHSSDEIVSRYKRIGVLLLDDVGAERIQDWTREQFYLIMDYRWHYQLPTAMTSNLKMTDLYDIIGERTVSRIIGMTKMFTMRGTDRRLNKESVGFDCNTQVFYDKR